jgi:hypothetical protein
VCSSDLESVTASALNDSAYIEPASGNAYVKRIKRNPIQNLFFLPNLFPVRIMETTDFYIFREFSFWVKFYIWRICISIICLR